MNQEYSQAYSEGGFWATMAKLTHTLGDDIKELAIKAMTLYYCVKDDAVPTKAKVVIIGALGYLIFPLDMAPDFFPGIGWIDDLIVIRAAYLYANDFITPKHRADAEASWASKFGGAKKATKAEAAEEAEVVQEGPIS